MLVTADFSLRRGKPIPMKEQVDAVLGDCPSIEHVVVVRRTGGDTPWTDGRDVWWHEEVEKARRRLPGRAARRRADALPALHVRHDREAEGHPPHDRRLPDRRRRPRTTLVFDIKPDTDVYWCSADIGWVTGHSYIVYGPLAQRRTSILYEGAPDYPDKDRWWEIVERYKVHDLLHGADRDPRLHQVGPRVPGQARPLLAAPARVGRRADQPARVALVPRGDRRRALPDRRHLVADRDRPHHDHAAAGHHRDEAGLGDAPVPGRRGRGRRRATARSSRRAAASSC